MKLPSEKEAVILQLLMNEPDGMYGLEMVRESDQLTRGTVYVTLNRMAEKGFVESRQEDRGSEGGLPKRVFTITSTGRSALRAYIASHRAVEEAWSA